MDGVDWVYGTVSTNFQTKIFSIESAVSKIPQNGYQANQISQPDLRTYFLFLFYMSKRIKKITPSKSQSKVKKSVYIFESSNFDRFSSVFSDFAFEHRLNRFGSRRSQRNVFPVIHFGSKSVQTHKFFETLIFSSIFGSL